MTPKALAEAILATGNVQNLIGLEGESSYERLIQFWGVMPCGLEYSVRANRRGISLEVRSPARHKHQKVTGFREPFDPHVEPGPELVARILEPVRQWLSAVESAARAAPAPEELEEQALARVLEAEQQACEASTASQAAFLSLHGAEDGSDTEALASWYNDARQAATAARERWAQVYREVYTWDVPSE